MYEPKIEKEILCPIELGFDTFGGKWKSKILCVLSMNGSMRYNAIRKELLNITDAVLAAMLKELVRANLVTRQSFNEIPPRVEYCLTPKGHSVLPILQYICAWSRVNAEVDRTNIIATCKSCSQWHRD